MVPTDQCETRYWVESEQQDWQPPVDSEPDLEPIPISALEHFSYCPRQCGLIHLEQIFDENVFTLRGRLAHQRVDETDHETRPEVRREYGLPLWSRRLGLIGRADVVEFGLDGPYPIEHKIGKQRRWEHETIQLCAHAICLEEMLEVPVPRGAVYYHGSRKRREVHFDAALRAQVETLVEAARAMLRDQVLPAAPNDARCRHCSLNEACLPAVVGRPARARAWRAALYRLADRDGLGAGEG